MILFEQLGREFVVRLLVGQFAPEIARLIRLDARPADPRIEHVARGKRLIANQLRWQTEARSPS
jgi:hypothetical protein